MEYVEFQFEDSESDQELFPVVFQESNQNFVYDDPLLVSGVLRAVVEEDLEKIKKLISEGKSVNINDNHGNTPLHVAVIRNLSEIVDYLLTLEDVAVNCQNEYGETSLFQAVKDGHLDLVKILLKAKCNVNLSNFEDVTPLHLAIKYPDIALLLIENGANVNAQDYSGETPLHEAVNEECIECVCMLLYYNADPNVECDNGITAFMKSIILGNVDIQGILMDYVVDFNTVAIDGMTILNLALTHTCPHVQEIINRGADINYEHDTLNAFLMCLKVSNIDHFKLIWSGFKYQKLCSLRSYLHLILFTIRNIDDVYDYLRAIINSGNVGPIFEDFDYNDFFDFLILRVPNRSVWLDIQTELLCLYLSHGYTLCSDTIDQIYDLYGYCNLLDIFLQMDIHEGNRPLTMARIFYNPKITVDEFKIMIKDDFNKYADQSPYMYVPYIRIPGLSRSLTLYEIEEGSDIDQLSGFPSLLELARNKTRDYLVQKFQLCSSSQYHFFIKHFPISIVYKDILTFKRPIYIVR